MDMGWVHPWVGLVWLDRLKHLNFISVTVVATVTVIVRLDCFVTVCRRHIITDIRSGSVLYFRICYILLKYVAFAGIIVEWWVSRAGSLREHRGLGWV